MQEVSFKVAFDYPFKKSARMWYILWMLVPIIGWFVLGGYTIRIAKEFMEGKFNQAPKLEFNNDLSLGFMMFIKSIPFVIVYMAFILILEKVSAPLSSLASFFIAFFMFPILFMNFFKKETVKSLFEFELIETVFKHFGDYLMALLKSILLGLLFLVMWVILVGIPAGTFTKNIFLADFYRRRVK